MIRRKVKPFRVSECKHGDDEGAMNLTLLFGMIARCGLYPGM